MKNQPWITSLLFVVGLVLGPFALLSLKGMAPVFGWTENLLTFLSCLFIAAVAVGLQVIGNSRRFGIWIFELFSMTSITAVGSGTTALAMDFLIAELGALSVLFLIVGAGFAVGALASRLLLYAKFPDAS